MCAQEIQGLLSSTTAQKSRLPLFDLTTLPSHTHIHRNHSCANVPMKSSLTAICLTLVLSLGTISAARSADFDKGFAAYESGDYATALREWTPLAKQGNARAQHKLGVIYDNGQGVPRDYKTAEKWYTVAAEQRNAPAQYNLGVMYANGRGVPQDYKTAVKWYRLAAEQGRTSAQASLGVRYAFGQGVLKDYVYAHMWGSLAASNGNKKGGKLRDFVEKKMTPTDISAAQKLARECVRKKYKDC